VLGFDFKSANGVVVKTKSVNQKGAIIEQLLLELPKSDAYAISN
jgi:leucyl aminopeptidase (aminopeptidase T)